MAVVTGTVTSINLIAASPSGRGNRKTYAIGASWSDAFTGSADTVALEAVGASIAAATKNGKTVTLRSCCGGQPGLTDAGADVYAGGSLAVSSDDLTFDLVTSTGADLNLASTSEDVQLIVSCDEA